MKFQGFVGPSYKLDSVNVDCQRSVNMYPEVIESGNGKEAATVYLKSTPGLVHELTIGDGPIRLIHKIEVPTPEQDPRYPKILYLIVSGNQVHTAAYVGGNWVTERVREAYEGQYVELMTSTGGVRAKSNVNSTFIEPLPGGEGSFLYGALTYFADGQSLYVYNLDYSMGAKNEICGPVIGIKASHVEMIDGFFIINEVGTSRFFVSNWNSPTFDPLSFASAEGDPDSIVAIIAKNRELWLLNERSTEVFYNSGNADFPFERVQGGFIEKGCLAPYSVSKIGDSIFWLGRDAFGQGVVYSAQGLTSQRISTYAIESAIQKYANPNKATSYTYSDQGHSFYVLNFDEGTWVYDLSTGMWHERAFTNEGALERHRVDVMTFMPELGQQWCGDYQNGKIYRLDFNAKTDDGNPITRMRVFPHASAGLKRLFFKSLQIDMETGVGLDGDVQGSDPQAMLDWSNDGGHTWSSEAWASIGKKIGGIGQFKKRVIWNRLGSSRDRVFRLKITDPVSVTLIGAEVDLEVGAN